VDALIATVAVAQTHIRSGRVQALAVASPTRVPSLPNVPTFREAGLADVEAAGWTGMVAPARTPYEPVTRLSVAIADTIKLPGMRERFATQGADIVNDGPDEFASYLHSQVERWAKVVKASGLGPE
jgi:tripartite-type tricarboxylate transporter receptor subunit TctC